VGGFGSFFFFWGGGLFLLLGGGWVGCGFLGGVCLCFVWVCFGVGGLGGGGGFFWGFGGRGGGGFGFCCGCGLLVFFLSVGGGGVWWGLGGVFLLCFLCVFWGVGGAFFFFGGVGGWGGFLPKIISSRWFDFSLSILLPCRSPPPYPLLSCQFPF